jgi:hypothetical protein
LGFSPILCSVAERGEEGEKAGKEERKKKGGATARAAPRRPERHP